MASRPSRARGLKPNMDESKIGTQEWSRPSRARGLKPLAVLYPRTLPSSRPSRARGLKQICRDGLHNVVRRAPRGRAG